MSVLLTQHRAILRIRVEDLAVEEVPERAAANSFCWDAGKNQRGLAQWHLGVRLSP